MDTTSLNVVLLLDEHTKQRLIELSQLIAQITKSYFVLDEHSYLPHLSLYQSMYKANRQKDVLNAAAQLAKQYKSLEIQLSGYSQFSGYVYLDAATDDDLIKLHEAALDSCNPLREGLIPDPIQELIANQKLDQQQAKLTIAYGHPFTKELFKPHVTLARIQDEFGIDEILKKMPMQELIMKVDQIAVTNVGEHGTCNQVFEVFPLQ